MPYLTPDAKNQLSRTIRTLRSRLLTDLNNAVESTYRLSIAALDRAGLAEEQREKRRRLEVWLDEQVRAEVAPQPLSGTKLEKAKAEIQTRSLHNALKLAAATLLNRLVVIRQMESLGLLRTKVVTGGWSSPAYREFRDFAPDLCKDDTEGYGFLLQLLYDELALDLPGLFGRVGLTELFPIPASTLRAVIEALDALDPDTWRDDTTLGWVYQYWNDPEREALDAKLNSGGKVAPHEIASKTQMFTERYMVEWLLHNSLGQQWLAICQHNGWTPEAVADGTLDALEQRRQDWREQRERGEVALDALMPIETEQEERWKYWVKQPPLSPHPLTPSPWGEGGQEAIPAPLSLGRGAGGEGQSVQEEGYSQLAGRNRQIPKALLERAKELRQEQTSAEELLWECLRNRQLNNAKFRRQHNIGQIIADFYCHDAKLVIELDGGIHQQRQAEDRIRDEWATSNGMSVLRFSNDRVFGDLEGVLGEIAESLSPHPPSPLLPEEKGEQERVPTPLSLGRGVGGEGSGVSGPHPLTPSPQGEGEQEGGSAPLSPGRGVGGEGLPHGILYLSAYSGDHPNGDSLHHPACQPLHQAWADHGRASAPGKPLRHWLRLNFFKDVHLGMYEQRPIYFPLSSEKKNFVALISIHRWQDSTLTDLLADYLIPEQTQLDGEIADLLGTKAQGDAKTQTAAEKRYTDLIQLKTELDSFIQLVRQCAEIGPPPAKASDPQPETAAPYRMDLDDGVMINSVALWPLLAPQWAKPKTWWSELCTAKDRKDYDWSHLAARYFPQRVDAKCQKDPSLAVAHGCFWRYHPAKAYEWELRLQDEIGPNFTIDETDSDTLRQQFEAAHPQTVTDLREKEAKRRERKYKKQAEDQLTLPLTEE